MGFAARHPRYTIALVVLLFVSFLVLMNSDSSSVSRPYPISFHEHGHGHGYPPPGYVEEQINRSEAYYQESLKERQKLITKWGPSPSEVEAFPSKGEFYTLCEQHSAHYSHCFADIALMHRGLFYTRLSMPASNAAHWHPWGWW